MIFKTPISNIRFFLCLLFIVPTIVSSQVPERLVDKYLSIAKTRNLGNPVKSFDQWQQEQTVIVDNLKGFVQGVNVPRSKYGGVLSTQYGATGYFRTQKVNGRWWFVDPEGHLLMNKGINILKHGGGYTRGTDSTLSALGNWRKDIISQLQDMGFNSGGGWTGGGSMNGNPDQVKKMAWIKHLSLISPFYSQVYNESSHKGIRNNVMPVFHSGWINYVNTQIEATALAFSNDPYFIGIFGGNEQTFVFDALTKFLEFPTKGFSATDEGYLFALNWLRTRKNDQTADIDDVTTADEEAFFEVYVEAFFKPQYDAVKTYMPNNLYLGARVYQYHLMQNQIFATTYGKYADVMSFNRYTNWTEPKQMLDNLRAWAQKPWIATEFYSKAETSGIHKDAAGNFIETSYHNVGGAGQVVATHTHRGYFYQNLIMSWMQDKSNIGWHWFNYRDKESSITNKGNNGGVVNFDHEFYTDLTDLMSQLNNEDFKLIEFFDGVSYSNVLSIGDEDLRTNDIKIYPNPTSDYLLIDLGNLVNPMGFKVKITTVLGQKVFESSLGSKIYKIDTQKWLLTGVYFITITNSEGKIVISKKIIKS